MNVLPSAQALAKLVSGVTETMFGMSFGLAEQGAADHVPAPPWRRAPGWRTAVLPIAGRYPVTVAIASDPAGGAALGSAMFACRTDQVDGTMVDDSLSELVNIVAGQIKSALGLDQLLGLPSLLPPGTPPPGVQDPSWRAATLKTRNTEVTVWVAITAGLI